MATREVYKNGQPYERWADGTYTRYADDGSVEETRPLTQEESDALAAADQDNVRSNNEQQIRDAAKTAMENNRLFIQQTKPSTAAAQANQAYNQAVALSRQMNAVIRLILAELDATD